jgi:hypothetical protein
MHTYYVSVNSASALHILMSAEQLILIIFSSNDCYYKIRNMSDIFWIYTNLMF